MPVSSTFLCKIYVIRESAKERGTEILSRQGKYVSMNT
jgi:hypothetical protein